MAKWKIQLENFEALSREIAQKREEQEGKLRFNRSIIIANDVAEQFYCEKKVEMQYLLGEILRVATVDFSDKAKREI